MPYVVNEGGLDSLKAVVKYVINGGPTPDVKAIRQYEYMKSKGRQNKQHELDLGRLTKSSIMAASKDLVMSFPVICSDTLQPGTAAMVNKAIERNCLTALQLVFSSVYLKGGNGVEVIKQWHNNINANYGFDDYMDILNSIEYKNSFVESKLMTSNNHPDLLSNMITECNNCKFYPESSFSEASIGCFEILESYNDIKVCQTYVTEDSYNRMVASYGYDSMGNKIYTHDMNDMSSDAKLRMDGMSLDQKEEELQFKKDEAERDQRNKNRTNDNSLFANRLSMQKMAQDAGKHADQMRQTKLDRIEQKRQFNQNMSQRQSEFDQKMNLDKQKFAAQQLSDTNEYFRRQLMDNDVRKCNELVPSLIIIRYGTPSKDIENPNAIIKQEFIAGVKTRLIALSSEEIITNIKATFNNRISRLNWIRATTGEIDLVKDFIFAIDQAKIDAKQKSSLSKMSPIWRSLQYRSIKSNMNRLRKNKANDAGAITTLVISQEEVDYMNQNFNIDLSDPIKARWLMEQYNFMGIVIVNENFEIARFLFDGEPHYQDLAFSTLEKETGDGSYKKVVNLLSKINRG